MALEMITKAGRNRDNLFVCETVIKFGSNRREMRIDTRKNHFGGGVKTGASVVQVSVDGNSYTHAFGLAGGGDFSKTLIHDKAARGTEKVIAAQHAAALVDVEALFAEAVAHYEKA